MKVFVGGARAVKFLDPHVQNRLMGLLDKKMTILVGDANGVDCLVQQYAHERNYPDVMVYASDGKPRNNLGDWPVVSVNAGKRTGFAFYTMKDMAMANESDYGFMIWNGESKGTLNNILNLVKQNKKALVYLIPRKSFFCIKNTETVQKIVSLCGTDTEALYKNLMHVKDAMLAHPHHEQNVLRDAKVVMNL